jgi:formylglycine-generating enzyme required for sulfatase activity
VWEWVADTGEDGWGVLRGGSYLDTAHGVASARELPADPARATRTTGFRIAMDIDERREAWTGRS